MITRYFDVDPISEAIGYGFSGLIDRRQQIDAEHKRKAAEKKARRKKLLTLGLGAGVGAVAAPLLAPALGLAGTAAGVTAGGVGGIGAGVAIPATTGVLGAGGALSGVGALTAGLTGASIGAQAAEAFSEGDLGEGFGTIARPFNAILGRQQLQRERAADRETNIRDAMRLDRSRTDENIRQAEELSTIPTYGLPRSKATAAARAEYEAIAGQGPEAGTELDLSAPDQSFQPVEAYGPFQDEAVGQTEQPGPPPMRNVPGPSEIPGFKRDFGPAQYRQLAKIEQQRSDTVDNPDWVQQHTPEERAMQWHALARARQNVRVTTMPAEKQMMMPGPNGQMVPMQPGFNPAPAEPGLIVDLNGDIKPYVPTKKQEETTPWMEAPTPEAREAAKAAHLEAHRAVIGKEEYLFDPKQGRWELQKKNESGSGGKRSQAVAAAQKQFTTKDDNDNLVLPEDETVMAAVNQQERLNRGIELRDALDEAEGNVDPAGFVELLKEARDLYGRDETKWPDEVLRIIKRIDAQLQDALLTPEARAWKSIRRK